MLIIDEASRVSDDLYRTVRPFGKRGWFHEAWARGDRWSRETIMAHQCSRIPRDFLDDERRALGDRWYRQEYECSFEDAIDSVFAYVDIRAALADDIEPLVIGTKH